MRNSSDDTWNLIAQEVDETHKDVMAAMFSKDNIIDMISDLFDHIVGQSIHEAIKTVALRHNLSEDTVRRNYFHKGPKNESDTSRTEH